MAEKSLPVLREKLPHNLEEINGKAAVTPLSLLQSFSVWYSYNHTDLKVSG